MLCPYCRGPLEKKIDFIPISVKRKRVLNFIIDAGPAGVKKDKLKDKFFPASRSEVVVRTTIHHINQAIKPLKIYMRGGIIRLESSA